MDGVSFILMPASATTATASPPVTAAVAAAANPTAAASAAAAHLSWRPTPRDSPLLSLSTYDSIHSRASSPSFRPSPKLRTATPPVLPMLLPFHSPSSSSPSRSQPQTPASFHYPHHQYYTTSHPSTPSSATCPDYHPATPSKLASSSLLLTSISPSPPPLPPPSSTDTHSYIHNYATPNTPASNPTSTTNSPRFNHSSPRSSIFQYPASVPMTPSSSMGLPSPTFPPRKLSSLQPPAPPPPSASASGGGSVPMTPTHLSHVHSPRTLSPIVPPRSPARMPSVVAVSGGGVMTTPSSAASSRRNSWQVSLRLASSRAAGAGRRRGSILFGGRGSFSRSVSRRSLKGSVVGLDVGEGEGDAEGEGRMW
ncbi:uncharacterized protein EI90DRAFT_286164 [Cantharellus anzutake]|uniref:uncharacterized protein n=1 Tax=Cantharellus anzutake TaxID=1750568 RepID=UPI001904D98B|nr:uncharacterized protein EI90DRAFT_286164 [Cantharellus anzutake]KAF8335987.1 hypothetical protein EI90DRAFT_286164 [Cantharellus anzutake]